MVVTSFCRCMSVETGTLIIGILDLIISLASIVVGCIQSIDLSIIIHCIVHFLVSILLIVGVRKKDAGYILPLLSVYLVGLILEFPMILIQNIRDSIHQPAPVLDYVILYISWPLGLALCIYFFMVIYSFHQELLHRKFSSHLAIDSSS